jgi:hypothetical protein
MTVAALYDVHGNLPALAAVLSDPRLADAEVIVSGGDLVMGPLPAECLDLLDPAVGHRAGLELVEAGATPALAGLVPIAVGIEEQESHVELRAALDFGGVAAIAHEVAMPADFLVVEPDAEAPLAGGFGCRRRNDGCGRGDACERGDERDGNAHRALRTSDQNSSTSPTK